MTVVTSLRTDGSNPILVTGGAGFIGVSPLVIQHALADKSLPVYGDGLQTRNWLYVSDHRATIAFVADRPGHDCRYAINAAKIRLAAARIV